MRHLARWLLLWVVAEIIVLILVARLIGWGWVIVALCAGAVVGVLLIRSAGSTAVRAAGVGNATDTRQALARAGWRFTSGVAIALPGLLSDLVGAVLVIPWVQTRLGRRILAHPLVRPWAASRFTAGYATGEVIDGEILVSQTWDTSTPPARDVPPQIGPAVPKRDGAD